MRTPNLIGNRTHTRFQVLNCRVQLKYKGILGCFGKEIHQLSLIDLSSSGIQAISSKTLKEKREYEIALLAPAFRNPILAKGRVIWNKPYTGDTQQQYYQVGLEFTYYKDKAMKKIKDLEGNPQLRATIRGGRVKV